MNLREYLNNNSALVTIAAIALLVISLGIIVWQSGSPSGGPVNVYFYDLNTQKLVAAKSTELPPADLGGGMFRYPDGEHGSAVRAMVFSCTDCEDVEPGMSPAEVEAAGGTIAYVQTMSQRARDLQQKMIDGIEMSGEDYARMESEGNLVSDLSGQRWYPADSQEAMQLMEKIAQACPTGEFIKSCLP